MAKSLNDILSLWITKAEHDLATAQQGRASKEPMTDIICFHCQQAVEKYLKLFLVAHNQNPPKTHNISELFKQCAVIDKGFEQYSDKMAYLTEYAVEVRYPDDFYMPTMIEADGALVAAQQIRKFVRELLKV